MKVVFSRVAGGWGANVNFLKSGCEVYIRAGCTDGKLFFDANRATIVKIAHFSGKIRRLRMHASPAADCHFFFAPIQISTGRVLSHRCAAMHDIGPGTSVVAPRPHTEPHTSYSIPSVLRAALTYLHSALYTCGSCFFTPFFPPLPQPLFYSHRS